MTLDIQVLAWNRLIDVAVTSVNGIPTPPSPPVLINVFSFVDSFLYYLHAVLAISKFDSKIIRVNRDSFPFTERVKSSSFIQSSTLYYSQNLLKILMLQQRVNLLSAIKLASECFYNYDEIIFKFVVLVIALASRPGTSLPVVREITRIKTYDVRIEPGM